MKDELGEQGFDLWSWWSQTSYSYNPVMFKLLAKFEEWSFHINTLFYEVTQNRYVTSKPCTTSFTEETGKRKTESKQRRLAEKQITEKAWHKSQKTVNTI